MSEIEVKHLSKTFEQKGVHVDALKDINLTIGAGDIYGIPSECPVQEKVLWYDA